MFSRMHRALGLALSAAVLSLATSVGAASAASADPGVPPPQTGSHVHTVRNVCDAAPAGFARCTSRIRTDSDATLARPASGKNPTKVRPDVLGNNGAYDPSYLQSAYVTPSSSSGTGQTVAIVDAYDDPNAEADLANYRSYFGLPACSSSTGCFRKVNQNGQASPLPTSNASWSQEISLDLDMVSAICPSCNILLVEGNSASYSDLGTAVNSAVSLGAAAVSNSYGGSEFSTESNYDGDYNHPGVAVTVSSGDNGYGVEYPAASQYVTAVGGTSLNQATNTGTRNATETVWSGAGSGCSTYETKPSWQKDAGCAKRTVADVSAVADPNTGVWVYDTYAYQGQSGWLVFGGTSVASPIAGSVYALAGSGPSSGTPSSYPYAATSGLNDITSGTNGSCGSYLCTGEVGYDGPTGLGTPNTSGAFAYHAATDFSMAVSPTSASATPGSSATYSVSITSLNGYASAVNLSVTGLPSGATASFSPNPVTPGNTPASSALTVAVATGTANGSYKLTITGTGSDASATTHTTTATLTVSTPDFSIGVSPSSASVPSAGGSASYTVSLTAASGYSSAVNLTVSGLPSGATPSFSPNPATPASQAATSSLTVTVSSGVAAQTYPLTITGTGTDSGATTHSASASLVVNPPATFSLSASPNSQSVKPGGSASYTTTLSTSSGYSSAVNLAVSGLPSGASASFNPPSVTPTSGGASSTLSVQTSASTPAGSYSLTISATGTDSASTARTTNVTLNVGDFSVSAASPTLTVAHGSSGTDVITLTALGAYSSSVTLSVSGLPARTTASFSPNPVTPTASSTLTVSANHKAQTGTYSLTVTAQGADGTTHTTPVSLTIQ